MAECLRFTCSKCSYSIESWSDGNPYYYNEENKKVYAYHPNHADLERCLGNDVPHVCLDCAEPFVVDSNVPKTDCPKCNSTLIIETFLLDGKTCPTCHQGQLARDPEFWCVS
jgi:DNA-directed RNA polymerase subunit RPC12/RpoP